MHRMSVPPLVHKGTLATQFASSCAGDCAALVRTVIPSAARNLTKDNPCSRGRWPTNSRHATPHAQPSVYAARAGRYSQSDGMHHAAVAERGSVSTVDHGQLTAPG